MPSDYVITRDNSIEQHAPGLALAANDTVRVEQGGWVKSTGWSGITSTVFARYISISGMVSGAGGSGISLSAGGTIAVDKGGEVSGNQYALFLSGTNVNSSVRNFGTLTYTPQSNDKGAISVYEYGYGAFSLYNEGEIRGKVDVEAYTNTITNKGTINGAITFGNGADIYDGTNGEVTGEVRLGYGDDRFYGGLGNETIMGGGRNDTLVGGGGSDLAKFTGAKGEYTITKNVDDTVTVADSDAARDGTDLLKGIRFAKFGNAPAEVLYNTSPDAIALTQISFAENLLVNTPLATLSAKDAEGDALTYTLTDPTGTFRLDGNALVLVKPLDYETRTSYAITIEAKDEYEGKTTQSFTLSVTDIGDTPGRPGEPGTPTDLPLTLIGTPGADTLAGRGNNDVISGLGGKDRLYGNNGNDKLYGGLGNDTLSGGAGQDIFVFDQKLARTNAANKRYNLDTISDFSRVDDTIHLAKSVFSKIAKKGVLAKSAFYAGDKAHDASDRILHNKQTGALLYDKDGTGAAEAIQFATIAKNLKGVSNLDFFVI
jgi:Ca2+-binding RTX toxin-like protein